MRWYIFVVVVLDDIVYSPILYDKVHIDSIGGYTLWLKQSMHLNQPLSQFVEIAVVRSGTYLVPPGGVTGDAMRERRAR